MTAAGQIAQLGALLASMSREVGREASLTGTAVIPAAAGGTASRFCSPANYCLASKAVLMLALTLATTAR